MTEYSELVNDLRDYLTTRQIADLLEAQAKRIAELEAAIEPFRRVKGITSIYEYVPVEALRDDEVFNFRMNGAEMKTIRAALKGEK